jgi:hypothetical protein
VLFRRDSALKGQINGFRISEVFSQNICFHLLLLVVSTLQLLEEILENKVVSEYVTSGNTFSTVKPLEIFGQMPDAAPASALINCNGLRLVTLFGDGRNSAVCQQHDRNFSPLKR